MTVLEKMPRPGGPRAAFSLEEHAGVEPLEALYEEWIFLWDRCPWATPFQSPAWQLAWCEAFGPGEVYTLGLRHYGDLVALAPFVRAPRGRGSGERVMMPLGAGVSDYLDVLIAPEHKRAGAEAILQWLSSKRDMWDVCELPRQRFASPLLGAAAPSALLDRRWDDEPSPILRLPGTVEELDGALPHGLASSLRYDRRRAARMGRARIERAELEGLNRSLDTLFALHEARWGARGQPGVLRDRRVQAFHRRSARGLYEIGALRLYVLFWQERPAAALYAMTHRGRLYYYIGGFDPGLRRYSVGSLIIAHAIEEAIREGAFELDFLRGREPYKYRWGAVDRSSYGRTLRHAPEKGGA